MSSGIRDYGASTTARGRAAAGDRRNNAQVVTLFDRCGFSLGKIANVIIIQVKIYKASQLAFVGIQVLAQLGMPLRQLTQGVTNGAPADIDGILLARVLPEWSRYVDLHKPAKEMSERGPKFQKCAHSL